MIAADNFHPKVHQLVPGKPGDYKDDLLNKKILNSEIKI
jgi:hypothetical protein